MKQPIFIGIVFALLLLLPQWAQAKEGKLITLITEREADAPASFWWTSATEPSWTMTDLALHSALQSRGLSILNPAELPSPPTISQVVYGHAELNSSAAINLASIFGTPKLLVGEIAYDTLPKLALTGESGVQVKVALSLLSTNSSVELLRIELESLAYHSSPEQARAEALDDALNRIAETLTQAGQLQEHQHGVELNEPTIVLTGLRDALPLVAIKRALKENPEVDDVFELWAAEGVIAIELNPGVDDAPELIVRLTDSLLRTPFDDFLLQEVKRESKRIEIAVAPKPIEGSGLY